MSLAEILTGTYFAPLGFSRGLLAILVGHVIGCLMLFCAGVIGGSVRKSAMETAKMSFGSKGGLLFSVLNIVQLVGGTAIMNLRRGAGSRRCHCRRQMDLVPAHRRSHHCVDRHWH